MSAVTVRDTSATYAARAPKLAVLPVGSVEQHGPHLPLSTDLVTVEAVAARVCTRLDAYQLPAIPFGSAIEHIGIPGTIAIRPETLAAYVTDAVRSLARSGIEDVCVLSGHGGNLILRPTIRQLNLSGGSPRTILFSVSSWMFAEPSRAQAAADDRHAGEWETSIMLELDPAAVLEPYPADSVPVGLGGEVQDYIPMRVLLADGVWGRPSLASREKGRYFLERAVEYLVEQIPSTFSRLDAYTEREWS